MATRTTVAKGLGQGDYQFEITAFDTGHENGPIYNVAVFKTYQFRGKTTRDYKFSQLSQSDYMGTLKAAVGKLKELQESGSTEEVTEAESVIAEGPM